MSDPYLLVPELLDDIIDLLRNTERALRNCCLVSKSWIPRTRRYLFVDIKFRTEGDLQSWKETFPDPSTSPACYAKTLHVNCPHVVTPVDAEAGGWITGFSQVERLAIDGPNPQGLSASLVPFHGFSPVIISLRVTSTLELPSSRVFDLILSFPLLENLSVFAYDAPDDFDGLPAVQPSNPPTFAGTLELPPRMPIARRLLALPGGIHFRRLVLKWFHEHDILPTMVLVKECSHTLESLDIDCRLLSTHIRYPRAYRELTSVSRIGVGFGRPLRCDETQRCGFSGQFMERRLDRRGTPNHHTKTSRLSTNLALCPI